MLNKKALAATAAGAEALYVEDVFSTYLYTGDGSGFSVNNGIDLSGEGGMVWLKDRTSANIHELFDTARGATYFLRSNGTDAQTQSGTTLTAFNNNGFTIGDAAAINTASNRYASWTFRKAEKFFDVVTYNGTSSSFLTVNHNLGSIPGCIIVKCTTAGSSENWIVYHRSGGTYNGVLNSTSSFGDGPFFDNITSTSFRLTGNSTGVSTSGRSYVAYLFAHDAGGFGDAGDQSVIKCGSVTNTASGVTVDLGWEPQWVLFKKTTNTQNWYLLDTMRGWVDNLNNNQQFIYPNLSNAEGSGTGSGLTSKGFTLASGFGSSDTFIYIAIRRGPMKTPEAGTEVFSPIAATGSTGTSRTVGFPTDLVIASTRTSGDQSKIVEDRLRGFANSNAIGAAPQLVIHDTASESTGSYPTIYNVWNTTRLDGQYHNNISSIWWHFRRAPGFMDIVCYTGTGSANLSVSHNLGVVPELMIIRRRNSTGGWNVGTQFASSDFTYATLHTNNSADLNAAYNNGYGWYAKPTSTAFTLDTYSGTNASGGTYVAYLFASVTGVSKVGSYTGNGSSLSITTGFQPRFILVKRTNSTGNWIVGDSARGLVAGNDPYLLLNTQDAEDTDEDWVDISSTGFTVNQTTASNANVNTGTYIYLAIA